MLLSLVNNNDILCMGENIFDINTYWYLISIILSVVCALRESERRRSGLLNYFLRRARFGKKHQEADVYISYVRLTKFGNLNIYICFFPPLC